MKRNFYKETKLPNKMKIFCLWENEVQLIYELRNIARLFDYFRQSEILKEMSSPIFESALDSAAVHY